MTDTDRECLLCDACTADAAWLAYAAFPAEQPHDAPPPIHPTVARYPAPMIRACNNHLTDRLTRDTEFTGSTAQWVIVPAKRP
jgi:hypothetical protein